MAGNMFLYNAVSMYQFCGKRGNVKDSHEGENEELSAFALAVLMPGRMLSYIGAGTGSLIIQVVIAATVGGLFALKIYWRRIKAFFTRRKVAGDACDGQAGEGEPGEAAAPEEELPGSGEGETQEEIEAALLPVEAGCDSASTADGENEEGETPEPGSGTGEQPQAPPESGKRV